jgi:hypothetical protein
MHLLVSSYFQTCLFETKKVHTLPPLGLSDHDVVYIEADIWLRKVRQQSRKILRYDKANWDNIKSDLEDTLKYTYHQYFFLNKK